MSWIKTIPYRESSGVLRQLYQRIKGKDDYIDNILMVHALRPHTLKGHMMLYKNVLHHHANTLPKWLLEAFGVYTSLLNQCAYCVEHHYAGMCRLINDDKRSQMIRQALEANAPEHCFEGNELLMMQYTGRLTLSPSALGRDDIDSLRKAGIDDGQILEINQVVSYFAYANRTVLGLGVTTEGDILGLSPKSGDDDHWTHD